MNQHNVQNAPHYTSYHLQGEEEFKVRSLDNGCFPFAVVDKEWTDGNKQEVVLFLANVDQAIDVRNQLTKAITDYKKEQLPDPSEVGGMDEEEEPDDGPMLLPSDHKELAK